MDFPPNATQDGAAILVRDIHGMKEELEANGVGIGNWRVDERDGQKLQVFFVRIPCLKLPRFKVEVRRSWISPSSMGINAHG